MGDDPRSTPRPETDGSGRGYTGRPTHEKPEDGPTRDHESEAVERSDTPEERRDEPEGDSARRD